MKTIAAYTLGCKVNQYDTEAMLEAFEARFGKPLLYVDDLPELVSGAKAHGWNAAVFQSATQVETLLRQLG